MTLTPEDQETIRRLQEETKAAAAALKLKLDEQAEALDLVKTIGIRLKATSPIRITGYQNFGWPASVLLTREDT